LFALALGTFAIGTGEFGSNGAIQLFASDLNVSIPVATHAITAYALGVGGCCAGGRAVTHRPAPGPAEAFGKKLSSA
jgi:hypothetical protein